MIRNLIVLTAIALLMVPLPFGAMAQGNGVEYHLVVACPQGGVGVPCPVQATDPDDFMGDPSIAVDPDAPNHLIIASLHGSGDSGGPTPKSRSGQAFTTFTSTTHGAYWVDNPFFPPSAVSFNAYGEHPSITIDPFGHVYIGSLYAEPAGNGRFDYVIVAQNFTDIGHINRQQDGEFSAVFIPPNFQGNRIEQMWYRYDARSDTMAMIWHESRTPYSVGADGQVPASWKMGDITGAASGLTRTLDEQGPDEPMGSIGMVWRSANEGRYTRQAPQDLIGPCDDSTNPVMSEGFLYVGCRVGNGTFAWDSEAEEGQYVMFRMAPNKGVPEYLGPTPAFDGSAKLGARSDGRLAIASSYIDDDSGLVLGAAFGSYDAETGEIAWGHYRDYAAKLGGFGPGVSVTESNVQDLIYREYSGVIQLIFKVLVEPDGIGTGAAAQTIGPTIRKSIVAIDETHGLLLDMNLDIGNPLNRTDPVLLAGSDEAFNDLSDDFLQLPPAPFTCAGRDLGAQYSREFFAVADYGIVIFAEVCEFTTLRGPAFVPPPPVPTPLLAPAASLTATQVLAPAAGITISSLIAASFIVNRRKNVSAAHAKGKK